jgi:hypothetical protein
MPSIAETLDRQGYERGRKHSDLRARRAERKNKLRTAVKMKESGAEISFISKITEVDKDRLERFFKKIRFG